MYIIEREQKVRSGLTEAFSFYADPRNLERITPPWLRFEIETSDPIMGENTEIEYRLKLDGLPIRWTSRIVDWDPPFGFTDLQIRGPYKYWRHEHALRQVGPEVSIHDLVRYQVPGGLLAPIIHRLYVTHRLRKIFDYRRNATAKLVGLQAWQGAEQLEGAGAGQIPERTPGSFES